MPSVSGQPQRSALLVQALQGKKFMELMNMIEQRARVSSPQVPMCVC